MDFVFIILIKNLKENLKIKNINQLLLLKKIEKITYIIYLLMNNLKEFFSHFNYIFIYVKL